MVYITFKQKCSRCKDNMVLIKGGRGYQQPICFDCQKKELDQPIEDEKMKEFFDIPEKFYEENAFLRSIKINYLRYQNLSERQMECFEKTVNDMKKKLTVEAEV